MLNSCDVIFVMLDIDLPLDDVRFVVADVETTGGSKGTHRMTELGFCVIEDGVIVKRFTSLINPRQPIPDFITLMTGITNAMVEGAPEEDEVIPRLLEELRVDGTVFAAHNVGFDWGFVSTAMMRSGEDVPDRERLCTCRLSRRISSGLQRHDLGSVADYYEVKIQARHRALGDAEATAEALVHMIARAKHEHEAQTLSDLLALQTSPRTKPKPIPKGHVEVMEQLKDLPDEPGVYYFYNTKKKIVYVGKAKSLKRRVQTYFQATPKNNRKVSRMMRFVRSLHWETTGTELGALLLESREIKRIQPSYNSASLDYASSAFLRFTTEDYPRLELINRIEDDNAEYYGPFRSQRMAERIQEMIVKQHGLRTCNGVLHPNTEMRPCFSYHIKLCAAPCACLQSKDDYRTSVNSAREYLSNVERGAMAKLADQMRHASENMDFERAAMLRDGIREIERVTLHAQDRPLAVSDTNVIIVVPTVDRYSTVEVFFLRSGRLALQRVVGTASRMDDLHDAVHDVFTPEPPSGPFSHRELDELRLITSWLYQRRERSATIIVNKLDVNDVCIQMEKVIRSFARTIPIDADSESYNEYSQMPEVA